MFEESCCYEVIRDGITMLINIEAEKHNDYDMIRIIG